MLTGLVVPMGPEPLPKDSEVRVYVIGCVQIYKAIRARLLEPLLVPKVLLLGSSIFKLRLLRLQMVHASLEQIHERCKVSSFKFGEPI